ncbi:hypothetical protein [Nocardioides currus]|uniref:Uncharacterized protein n=1 Tax=Nocardioides currus TaxID=2133958 RepID=A0A2R7YWT7_9ACTN|nr:hypothetical protein [Nocardioides currus]PUA80783.1 hypothetical protein C7S10_13690 [Nocardioides currus]
MNPDEQREVIVRFDEDQLFTAAVQLMRRIHDEVVHGNEDAVHGDLPRAIDDLNLGPWHELERSLVADWPYAIECQLLAWLMRRLEAVSSDEVGLEAVVTARWLMRPNAVPLWTRS